MNIINDITQPNKQSVRQWSGRPGFNPKSSNTKDSKNGTWSRFV